MDEEKQIEEMATIILKGEIDRNRGIIDCSKYTTDLVVKVGMQRLGGATALYNAGYRRESEVAREIFEEIDRMCIDPFGNFNHRRFAELKKKYEVNKE